MNATKDLLYRVADDCLIIAHRNSEWTGLGPLLEEDIAFSSIAQDKLGHALALYRILNEEFGERDPDTIAFTRNEKDFTCCHFVELPNGEYDFSLMRHFLFDAAEFLRWTMLKNSSLPSIAALAAKIQGETKYHVYHGRTWVIRLASAGNEESKARMQSALETCWPFALGMFEHGVDEQALIREGVFTGEDALKAQWEDFVRLTMEEAGLTIPEHDAAVLGGRKGYHTEHLQPLLDEMTVVFRTDPQAEW